MSIKEAIEVFKNLLEETKNKQETIVYEGFTIILNNLKNKELTEKQLSRIEDEIGILNLKSNPENKKRYFSKKLTVFKLFLKKEFSLITEGYYTAIGLTIGMSLGMGFGLAIGSIIGIFGNSERLAMGIALGSALGMGLGLTIGLLIGRNMDIVANNENRVLK
ncbi:hypothetical protein FHR24_003100 [Wenyingzhuangia heitensis]|uniref:Glycine zipper family protein n=1 Tax=Wenyingzhuangia heitensis TaxID=1487859 RepID=A0ABX0UFG2_9FLAO|nr:hypothetical protein [Wenyingzhuangia heitensis]NIJ46610.1 hypothetical protein [Wenyingzhuangia heitensis]